jgi:hypothetical protein
MFANSYPQADIASASRTASAIEVHCASEAASGRTGSKSASHSAAGSKRLRQTARMRDSRSHRGRTRAVTTRIISRPPIVTREKTLQLKTFASGERRQQPRRQRSWRVRQARRSLYQIKRPATTADQHTS